MSHVWFRLAKENTLRFFLFFSLVSWRKSTFRYSRVALTLYFQNSTFISHMRPNSSNVQKPKPRVTNLLVWTCNLLWLRPATLNNMITLSQSAIAKSRSVRILNCDLALINALMRHFLHYLTEIWCWCWLVYQFRAHRWRADWRGHDETVPWPRGSRPGSMTRWAEGFRGLETLFWLSGAKPCNQQG